jgi:GntR family transcriptional repressor for pyruvate dehydrogenase complex
MARQAEATGERSQGTLAARVAHGVLQEIRARGLGEGDLFMTEAEIESHYKVSRNIAREAVSRLHGLGVLESRQGKGLLVGKPDPVALLSDTIDLSVSTASDLAHVAQLRYVLEVGASDLAAESATEEETERLLAVTDEHVRLVEGKRKGGREEREIEADFHGLILAMTHSPLVAGMHRVLADYFESAATQVEGWTQVQPHALWQHRAIAEAIRQRDPEQVRALMRQHLRPVLEWSMGVGGE